MSTLKLYGMRAAYDEVRAADIKRRREAAADRRRSAQRRRPLRQIPANYCQTAANQRHRRFRLHQPINEALIRYLASGGFLAEQRNAMLIGGPAARRSRLN
jgi:hypothetical protein